jgi:WhiB family redox-sensing transcriptional regulator
MSLTSELRDPDRPADWRALGECLQLDPEAFFPDPGASSAAALSACGRCVVRRRCLEWALAHDIRFGIWGGLTQDERRALPKADSALQAPTGAGVTR